LHVCDRAGDRIQVFHPDGTFVKEGFIEKETLGSGTAWDLAFSSDADQRYIYLADGVNSKVHIIDRESLEVLTSFGDGGRHPELSTNTQQLQSMQIEIQRDAQQLTLTKAPHLTRRALLQ
jgi:hypothetical protein